MVKLRRKKIRTITDLWDGKDPEHTCFSIKDLQYWIENWIEEDRSLNFSSLGSASGSVMKSELITRWRIRFDIKEKNDTTRANAKR